MDVGVLDATPEVSDEGREPITVNMTTNLLTRQMIHNIPQPDFEAFVANELKDDPNVEIRNGVAYVTSAQTADGVTMTVEERSTGGRWTITSRYVLACDGAKSTVRKDLDIQSEGEDGCKYHVHCVLFSRPAAKLANGHQTRP